MITPIVLEYRTIGITADQLLAVIPHEHFVSIDTIAYRVWQTYDREHIDREHLEGLASAGLLETYGPQRMPWGKSGEYITQYYRKVQAERSTTTTSEQRFTRRPNGQLEMDL